MDREILRIIKEEAKNGILTCEKAFEIAKKHGILPRDIGKICNDEGIKIKRCQLGCF